MRLLIAQDASQALIQLRRRQGRETEAGVERRIPGHMLEGGQGHRTQLLGACVVDRRFYQPASPALALQWLGNRDFMDMQVVAKTFCAEEALELAVGVDHHPAAR